MHCLDNANKSGPRVLVHDPLKRYERGIKAALECRNLVEDKRFAFVEFKLYRRVSPRLECSDGKKMA